MNRQQLLAQCASFNLMHGVTLRAIGVFADDELAFRPRPGMRTPRDLTYHIYSQERALADAAHLGQFTLENANRVNPEDPSAATALQALVTVVDVLAYADACHTAAKNIFESMSEEQIARLVQSPFGANPAWQYFSFAYDEHWHHRGQLYTYLRLLGKEPPMLYDYQATEG